jgi:hypothetical protein
MRLLDLDPFWIDPNVFTFRCPVCRDVFLSCKRVAMDVFDQQRLFIDLFGEDVGRTVVPCEKDKAWQMSSDDFATITVTPSIDASASGHWHGSITNGVIA